MILQQHSLSTALFAFVPLIKIAYFPFEKALNVYEMLKIFFSCNSWGVLTNKSLKKFSMDFYSSVRYFSMIFTPPCMHNSLFLNVTKKSIIIVDNFRGLFFPSSLTRSRSFISSILYTLMQGKFRDSYRRWRKVPKADEGRVERLRRKCKNGVATGSGDRARALFKEIVGKQSSFLLTLCWF